MLIRRFEAMPTRPCKLCLALQNDSVFADFEIDENGSLFLVRVSFDGYGCCRIDDKVQIGRMAKSKSDFLLTNLKGEYSEIPKAREILREYFNQNKSFLWEDALIEHELI